MEYLVSWKIDIDEDDPVKAALAAMTIMRDADPYNTATVFDVQLVQRPSTSWTVDLSGLNDPKAVPNV